MSGDKIASLRDALLKLSSLFGPRDRVSLVSFDDEAAQRTPLAPLSNPAHEADFRRAAMRLAIGGGTSVVQALEAARTFLPIFLENASLILICSGARHPGRPPLGQLRGARAAAVGRPGRRGEGVAARGGGRSHLLPRLRVGPRRGAALPPRAEGRRLVHLRRVHPDAGRDARRVRGCVAAPMPHSSSRLHSWLTSIQSF